MHAEEIFLPIETSSTPITKHTDTNLKLPTQQARRKSCDMTSAKKSDISVQEDAPLIPGYVGPMERESQSLSDSELTHSTGRLIDSVTNPKCSSFWGPLGRGRDGGENCLKIYKYQICIKIYA